MGRAYGEHNPVRDESLEWNAHLSSYESILRRQLASAIAETAPEIYIPIVVLRSIEWSFRNEAAN